MSIFTDPTDRKHEGWFNTSSCADKSKFAWGVQAGEGSGEEEAEEPEEQLAKLPFDGLVPYFTKYAHIDLRTAVFHLMTEHDVAVTCSNSILEEDDEYWSTGQVSQRNYCEFSKLSPMEFSAGPGHSEQLMIAGLACLYKNGAKAKGSKKEQPHFYSIGYQPPDDIQVFFKFEGQRVCLQMMGNSPFTGGRNIHLAAGSW